MKNRNSILCTTLLFAVALAVGGCKSSGISRASSATSSLRDSADHTQKTKAQIDTTLATLNGMVNQPTNDLRPQFKTFSADLKKLEGMAEKNSSLAAALQKKGNAYVAQWDKELATMQNEDVKQRSTERKAQVSGKFAQIATDYQQVKVAFDPLLSTLRDVQKHLNTDLTAGGVQAIREPASRAANNARPLQSALDNLSTDFKSLDASLAPATTPPQ